MTLKIVTTSTETLGEELRDQPKQTVEEIITCDYFFKRRFNNIPSGDITTVEFYINTIKIHEVWVFGDKNYKLFLKDNDEWKLLDKHECTSV